MSLIIISNGALSNFFNSVLGLTWSPSSRLSRATQATAQGIRARLHMAGKRDASISMFLMLCLSWAR